MAFYIKARLTNLPVTYYKNYSTIERKSDNIILCNTSASIVNVTLSYTLKDGDIAKGYVLFEFPIAAKGYLELKGRTLNPSYSLIAYASVTNVVVLTCDIIDESGEYVVPV